MKRYYAIQGWVSYIEEADRLTEDEANDLVKSVGGKIVKHPFQDEAIQSKKRIKVYALELPT